MKRILKKNDKKKITVFLCLAVLIIAVSYVCARKGQDNWTTEVYGSTSDAQIPITDDMEIKLDFEISEDNFQGINLRLSSKESVFENEKLECVMVDQESGEVISEDSLELKNDVYQSGPFIELPYEKSKGKSVSVYIIGMDIQNTPYLYVSDNFGSDTKMYIDGVQNERVLVFTGVYMTRSEINYQYLVKGGIFLLLLLLVFLWPVDTVVNESGHKESGRILTWGLKGWQWFKGIAKKYRKVFVFAGLSFLYLCLMVFVYECYVSDVVWDRKTEVLVENEKKMDMLVMDENTGSWEQTFTAKTDRLSSLYFNVNVQEYSKEAELHIQVYDENENICYHDSYVKVKEIAKKGSSWWKIFLQKEFEKSRNNNVIVCMEPVNFGNTRIAFKAGASDVNNYISANGQRLTAVPVLKVSYRDNEYLKTLYVLFCLMCYFFMVLVYYLFIIRHATVEQSYIPVVLTLGIIYMFVIPIYSVPDEYTHIDSAYIISNRILGIEEDRTFGHEYKRTIDIETEEAPEYYVTLSDYRRLYTSFFEVAEDQSLTSCYVKNALANANVLCFLPSAIGITIARILGLGTLPMLYLGRFMNLIVFTLLTYLAIRKLPGGKQIAMLYATLPIALQEAASFSYDSVINACAILFVAYCLYFAYDQKQKRMLDVAILLGLLFFVASIKGGVYIPLSFMILLIPFEQKWSIRKHSRFLFLVLFGIIVAFLQNNIASLIRRILTSENSNINPFTGSEMYTFGYLAKHPYKLVSLYVNTFFTEASRYMYEFFGGKMGSISNLQMPWMYVMAFLVIFLLVIFSKDDYRKHCRRFSLSLVTLMVFTAVVLVNLSMLVADTSTAYDSINGVQGRYFIPCILPLFVMVNYCLRKKYAVDVEKTKLIYYLVHIVFLFNIVMIAI